MSWLNRVTTGNWPLERCSEGRMVHLLFTQSWDGCCQGRCSPQSCLFHLWTWSWLMHCKLILSSATQRGWTTDCDPSGSWSHWASRLLTSQCMTNLQTISTSRMAGMKCPCRGRNYTLLCLTITSWVPGKLQDLLRHLRQDPPTLWEYNYIIQDQIQKGVVEVVKDPETSPRKTHYLPHHAVIQKDKETMKWTIIYDASAKSNGPSLNNCLYTGPKFNQKIMDILLTFHTYRVALTSDIEKAFLMVSIAERDWDGNVQVMHSGEQKVLGQDIIHPGSHSNLQVNSPLLHKLSIA